MQGKVSAQTEPSQAKMSQKYIEEAALLQSLFFNRDVEAEAQGTAAQRFVHLHSL
jgi:hypothetical protein